MCYPTASFSFSALITFSLWSRIISGKSIQKLILLANSEKLTLCFPFSQSQNLVFLERKKNELDKFPLDYCLHNSKGIHWILDSQLPVSIVRGQRISFRWITEKKMSGMLFGLLLLRVERSQPATKASPVASESTWAFLGLTVESNSLTDTGGPNPPKSCSGVSGVLEYGKGFANVAMAAVSLVSVSVRVRQVESEIRISSFCLVLFPTVSHKYLERLRF